VFCFDLFFVLVMLKTMSLIVFRPFRAIMILGGSQPRALPWAIMRSPYRAKASIVKPIIKIFVSILPKNIPAVAA
jgi:hypothetical protein